MKQDEGEIHKKENPQMGECLKHGCNKNTTITITTHNVKMTTKIATNIGYPNTRMGECAECRGTKNVIDNEDDWVSCTNCEGSCVVALTKNADAAGINAIKEIRENDITDTQ